MKELFKWNPHVDLTDFNFLDDKFVEKCKNGDPVSSDYTVFKSLHVWVVYLYVYICNLCRTIIMFM